MSARPLKAPFTYFGGKSRVAAEVWRALGDADNYIEPFAGSLAVLLLRPHPPRIETANDLDSYIANFWRATQHDPEAVAAYADGPVNEVDLHARHRWLVLSDNAKAFRQRMRTDPDYYDAKVAGWFCWGLCCWIGSGWCSEPRVNSEQMPDITGPYPKASGKGVHAGNADLPPAQRNRKPRIDGGEAQLGHGVHAKGLHEKRPRAASEVLDKVTRLPGVHGNHPQLADAYDLGRGVHQGHEPGLSQQLPRAPRGVPPDADGGIGYMPGVLNLTSGNTCADRRAWLIDWFGRLRDRLRLVRVCCGDWSRVCSSESVTTRLGVTGIFFDPPYGAEAGRNMNLYAHDSGTVAADVRAYCLERGSNPRMRLVLAGYEGEGHEALEAAGWTVQAWQASGGYGNRSQAGKANAKKERLWLSPHCQREAGLFDALEATA